MSEETYDMIKWVFSGIGVLIIGVVVNGIRKRSRSNNDTSTTVPQTQSLVVNNNILNVDKGLSSRSPSKNDSDELQKSNTSILFIDDNHSEFKMVSILKKSGWINTKSVVDITDLDDPKVVQSNIVFVDINGVGTTMFKDQGLGLASALKKRYPSKKIVLYSAETTGDRFHKALREVDDCLPKNAEPYQFIELIETFSKAT